jgi:hypothetical protein
MSKFTARWTKVDCKDNAQWAEIEAMDIIMPVPHKADRRLVTIIVSNDATGEKLGYFQIIPWPTVVTAWLRPGCDTVSAIHQTHQEMRGKGYMVTGCPINSKFHPHMERLGFTSSGLELFYSSEDYGNY